MESKDYNDWLSNLRPRINLIAFLLSLVLLSACSTIQIADEPHRSISETPEEYSKAQSEIEQGHYSAARELLHQHLAKQPVGKYTEVANFNIAYTLELDRKWQEAANKYREVIVNTARSAPRLQVYALYRLSYCLEALGDDAQVVAVLTDVMNRRQYLADEVAVAEVPARLAAAYSRTGNIERAYELYQQAEASLVRYRRQSDPTMRPEWLAKTLFHMGRLNLREVTWENFEIVVRPMSRAQLFLLESAELGSERWSQLAAEELVALYGQLWSVVRQNPKRSNDDVIQARANQERQWEMTFQLAELLEALELHRLPAGTKVSTHAETIYSSTNKIERQIRRLLAEQKVGSGLTPAARKRILGQRPLSKLPPKNKSSTEDQSTPKMTPPPAQIDEATGDNSSDPNL